SRDLVAVLADPRRSIRSNGAPREADGRAHVTERAEQRMIERDERTAFGEGGIALEQILDVLHRAGGDVEALQLFSEIVIDVLCGECTQDLVPVCARARLCEPEPRAQSRPIGRLEQGDRNPAIIALARVDALMEYARIVVASALGTFATRSGGDRIEHL